MNGVLLLPLTRGQTTIISEQDHDLGAFKWSAMYDLHTDGFYVYRGIEENGVRINVRLHRVILERKIGRELQAGELPDHENRNSLDNRRENLRLASCSQNMVNQALRSDNTSGYKGVYFNKANRKWMARMSIKGKMKYLGYYEKPEDAGRAYDDAVYALHGEFAFLNFPR